MQIPYFLAHLGNIDLISHRCVYVLITAFSDDLISKHDHAGHQGRAPLIHSGHKHLACRRPKCQMLFPVAGWLPLCSMQSSTQGLCERIRLSREHCCFHAWRKHIHRESIMTSAACVCHLHLRFVCSEKLLA